MRSLYITVVVFQLFLTFVALVSIYLVFALLDTEEIDILNVIAFFIFQPIFGILLSSFTIIICLVAGLPIRLIPRVYNWWIRKPLVSFAGCSAGVILLLASLYPDFTETTEVLINMENRVKQVPNLNLAVAGWFLTAFSLLHFYPMSIINWSKKKIAG